MTAFILLAVLMLLIALVLVVLPICRSRMETVCGAASHELDRALFHDQLSELEKERGKGTLTEAGFEQAQLKLKRRILDETATSSVEVARKPITPLQLSVVLGCVLPAMTGGLYYMLGNPQAVSQDAEAVAASMNSKPAPEQMTAAVEGLAAKLKANPDNFDGWVMLGRSYRTLGRSADAAAAYAKAENAMAGDPDFLTDYADVLASLAGGNLQGKPMKLINKALHLNPDHIVGLWLAGTASYDNHNYADAVVFWQRAVDHLPPDSEDARMLTESIADARRRSSAKVGESKVMSDKVGSAMSPADIPKSENRLFRSGYLLAQYPENRYGERLIHA